MNTGGVSPLVWPLDETPSTWTARWIAPAGFTNRSNACFRARKKIHLKVAPESLVLHISAESAYRFYVNGAFVGRGPVRGTRSVGFYDTFDIAAFLQSGENWIAADVHCHNLPTFRANPVEPGLFIQSHDEAIATDGSWQVQTADEWRSDAPLFTFQIGHMEWQDLRGEPTGWQNGRDTSVWQAATVLTANEVIGGKKLLPRDIPALREEIVLPVSVRAIASTPPLESVDEPEVAQRMTKEAHSPLAHTINCTPLTLAGDSPVVIDPQPNGSGVAILADFHDEINGGLEIDIDAPAGTILDIGYEESVNNERLSVTVFSYKFADRYILRHGLQTAGTAFADRGYRIVQLVLRNFSSPVRIHSIRAIQRRYPFSKRGSFTCSDALLNEIWDASAETIAACATDTFVDCPWRENTLYLNDMLVESVASLQAFGDSRLSARCYRLAASQPRPNGLLPGSVPAGKLPSLEREPSADRMVLLASNLFMANMLEEHLFYTGDEALVREMLSPLLRILETMASWEDSNGLIQPKSEHWNFIDWSYPDADPNSPDGVNYTAALNWFHVGSLAATARLLESLGDSRDATPYRTKAARLPAAIDRTFWNEQRNCYFECRGKPDGLATQLSHAVALLSGLLPAHRVAASAAALERDDLLAPDLYMHHLVLRAMVRFGKAENALARIRKYWGPIVLSGSPTIWECGVHEKGKAAFKGAGSLCHGFSTTPIDFFHSVILGVRPTAPGFRRCIVSPQMFDLDLASGCVPTPHGNLDIAWERTGDRMQLELDIPPGITVQLHNHEELSGGRHRIQC